MLGRAEAGRQQQEHGGEAAVGQGEHRPAQPPGAQLPRPGHAQTHGAQQLAQEAAQVARHVAEAEHGGGGAGRHAVVHVGEAEGPVGLLRHARAQLAHEEAAEGEQLPVVWLLPRPHLRLAAVLLPRPRPRAELHPVPGYCGGGVGAGHGEPGQQRQQVGEGGHQLAQAAPQRLVTLVQEEDERQREEHLQRRIDGEMLHNTAGLGAGYRGDVVGGYDEAHLLGPQPEVSLRGGERGGQVVLAGLE